MASPRSGFSPLDDAAATQPIPRPWPNETYGALRRTIWFAHVGARALKDYDYRGHSFGFRVARSQ
jgi:hypothetical protein